MGVRDELCGRTVGEFVLRERIGEGAYGAVYRCEQPLLGREAVIKVLHGKLRSRQIMIQRFLREARLASRLDHPYAAHVYAFGVEREDGLLWIAMEMVHGTPLDRWLRDRGPLKLAELVPFFERIAEVVQTGHEHGIVHRDLKPSNVMVVERAGRLLPKLLDFGIAKLLVEDGTTDPPPLLLEQAADAAAEAPAEPAVPAPPPLRTGTLTATMEAADPGVPLQSELTALGMVMGSPPYMAPEQWAGDEVGPRSDLYALGVLAYEALTGRRPFEATSMASLASLHANQPVPPLGGDLPAALDRFFARALAKRAIDRPGTALELAAGLRVAAGLAEDPAELPRLERGLHDAWVADAPQPLAEAVAALEGARNSHQARDAARELFRTLVRYLLALALASRAQVRDARTDPAAETLLRELGRRALDDAERVRLMRQLVRALADQRGAYPIPPLVDLLVPRAGQDEAIDPVLQLSVTTEPRGAGEDLLRSQLAQLVLAISRLLRAASFVLDYRLVVVRAGACESWMGLRRARRRALAIQGAAPAERQPALVDREGHSALVLWPLAQIAPPTPGAADELFFFDGPDRRGARLVAAPQGFALHDPSLWDWLGEHALARAEEDTGPSGEARAPYLGLEPFSAADAERFVGREREVDALANRLRTTPLQIVVGASGAGKSSFVHAGIVAALPPGSRIIELRPGSRPLDTLAARLLTAGAAAPAVRALQDAAPAAAPAAAAALFAGADDAPILVVIDQLEELFTMCRDEAARARFAVIIDALGSPGDGRVRVVCTLRDDFMMRAAGLPVLGPRLAASVFFLGNPSREDLIRTIVEPARRAGYDLSDAELAPEMADAVAGRPGALALLSFTASRLWELRDRQFHRLTRRAYEAMGGVGGALGQHAEQTIAALGAEDRELVRKAFRHLVTAEGTRAELSIVELDEVLGSPNATAVIDKLITARLLVIAEQEDGARVEVVHEALLAAWPRAQQWLHEDSDSARMRDQVRAAAQQWHRRNRERGLLWRDEPLAELERWRVRHEEHGLTELERAFADASRAASARGRRLRRLALGSAFAVLAVALAIMFWLGREATRQHEKAQAQLLESLLERGQQALIGGHPDEALKALGQAYGMGDRSNALRFMLARASESKEAELATLEGHSPGRVWAAPFSPDGTRLLTADEKATVRIWDTTTWRVLHTLGPHRAPVHIGWSPTGDFVTADAAGMVRLWTRDGKLRSEDTAGSAVNRLVFASGGGRFAVSMDDGTVAVGEPRVEKLLGRPWSAGAGLQYVTLDPTGQHVVTLGSPAVTVWSIHGEPVAKLEGHTARVWQAAFDPAGTLVVTASFDKTARIWDLRSGKPLHKLQGHEGPVAAVAVDGRSRRIATASADTTVRLWDLDTGESLATLRGHSAQVQAVVFGPDEQLVTGASDGTARVWDLTHGVQTAVYHHGGFLRVSIDPTGERLATASWHGTAKIWDLRRQSRLQRYAAPVASGEEGGGAPIRSMVEGRRLVRIGERGIASWDLASGRSPQIWSAPDVAYGALSSDGRSLIATDTQGFLHVIDERGATRSRFRVANERLSCLTAYPDGRRAATCGPPGKVSVWDLTSGKELASSPVGPMNVIGLSGDGGAMFALEYVSQTKGKARAWLLTGDLSRAIPLEHDAGLLGAAFSPDGTRLATLAHDSKARIWRRDGTLEATLEHPGPVWVAAWSSDGSWLATGTTAGTLSIWERAGWRNRKTIDAHVNFIRALAIDEGDDLIASAGGDGTIKLWDVKRLFEVARIPTGRAADHVAFDGDRLLISGPLATQAWRCDRYGF